MARIVGIDVQRLFGYFNYTLSLNTTSRISILHGPNGYGKTNLLRLVHAFAVGDYAALIRIPFKQLGIVLGDGSRVQFDRRRTARVPSQYSSGPYDCFDAMITGPIGTQRPGMGTITGQFLPFRRGGDAEFIPIRHPELVPEEGGTWRFPQTGEIFTTRQLVSGHSSEVLWNEPLWLRSLRTDCQTNLIATERLSAETARHMNSVAPSGAAVYSASQQVVKTIRAARDQFAAAAMRFAEALEQRFVNATDCIASDGGLSVLRKGAHDRLGDLGRKVQQLEQYGLLDNQESKVNIDFEHLDSRTLDLLNRTLDDIERNLAVFDGVYSRLSLLTTITNRNFFLKQLSIDRNAGFVVRSTVSGHELALSMLSTGEQHELLMVYSLLFETKRDTLVLLDEPELSLHVEWQEQFINDLHAIAGLVGFDTLIATHSPVLVGDNWGLMIDLSAQAGSVEQLKFQYEDIVQYGGWGDEELAEQNDEAAPF